jgi:hypothetical protein
MKEKGPSKLGGLMALSTGVWTVIGTINCTQWMHEHLARLVIAASQLLPLWPLGYHPTPIPMRVADAKLMGLVPMGRV